jgi:asparaginyl-tRNA synthetase
MTEMLDIARLKEKFASDEMRAITKIASEIRYCAGRFLRDNGFVELNPVIISPITDPLRHQVYDASIEYLGKRYRLTKSMIFHKQISLLCQEKIFIFSPNVRLEPQEYSVTKQHLIEFTQIDVEVRNARREFVMELAERLLIEIISYLKEHCAQELAVLKRNVKVPEMPFKRYKYLDAFNVYGKDFEKILSAESNEPFWIIDFPINVREFYDREYDENPGILCDMDLIYPEGYGEALSGGEREFKYERIIQRMGISQVNPEEFHWYLKFSKHGLILPSAGFGIGLERLTRYICGLTEIADATLFPKLPGKFGI